MASRSNDSGKGKAPRWALALAGLMLAAGAVAFAYVLFSAVSKPAPQGYAQFAHGAMKNLVVLDPAPPQPEQSLLVGSDAPDSLKAYRGEVILVNLWATWCAPCMEEMPTLGALARHFDGRPFHVVPVNFDSGADQVKAQAALAELSGGALPFMADPTRKMMFDVEARGMPTTILYDRDGREVARVTGNAKWDSPEAIAFIEAALAES